MNRPDPVTAVSTADFDPHPEGQYPMTCVDCVNLGERLRSFAGIQPYISPSVMLVFQSGETNSKGRLHEITAEFSVSMGRKASLRSFLESWRGRSYTEDQARAGVELHKLVGHPALVSVEHKTSQNNRTYGAIRSIAPLPKGLLAPTLPEYERPEFFAEKAARYAQEVAAFKAAGQPQHRSPGPNPITADGYDEVPVGLRDDDDGLPF